MRSLRFLLFVVMLGLSQSTPTTTPNTQNDQATTETSTTASQDNKTISQLVNEQTEVIRKLISAHKTAIEHPLLHDKESPTPADEQHTKQERERQSIEELKAKCEYYFKFHAAKQNEAVKLSEKISTATAFPFAQSVPQFLQKPAAQTEEFHSRPSSQNIANGHYVTTNKFWSQIPSAQYVPQGFNQFIAPTQPQSQEGQHFDANQQLIQGSQQIVYLPPYDNNVEYNYGGDAHQTFENHRFESHNSNANSNSDVNKIQVGSEFDTKNLHTNINHIGSYQQTYLPQTNSHHESQQAQYVKMEPVVLQKTLLSDGKTVYYWYKALPGYHVYSQYDDAQTQESSAANVQIAWDSKSHETKPSVTQPPTTQMPKTTQRQPSYDVTYPITESPNLYQSKLKFVVPLPYPSVETVNKYPWQLDPYAYYPKEFQPAYMNFPVPYAPSFQMIRAINVPQVKTDDKQ